MNIKAPLARPPRECWRMETDGAETAIDLNEFARAPTGSHKGQFWESGGHIQVPGPMGFLAEFTGVEPYPD